MPAPSIQTLGDLRRETADMPDDVRVVVDAHDGGYDDIACLLAPRAHMDQHTDEDADLVGRHAEATASTGTTVLCFSRYGLDVDIDGLDVARVADLRTKPAPLAEAEALRARVAEIEAERDRLRHLRCCLEIGVQPDCSTDDAIRNHEAMHPDDIALVEAYAKAWADHTGELEAERDRLARILAVEKRDATQAPSRWVWSRWADRWFIPHPTDDQAQLAMVGAARIDGVYSWFVWGHTRRAAIKGTAATYLEAMEAAGAALEAIEAADKAAP